VAARLVAAHLAAMTVTVVPVLEHDVLPRVKQTDGREAPAEPCRFARPGRCDTGQTFGEGAAVSSNVATEQAADAQLDCDGVFAPRQVGERPFAGAVDALGSFVAQRATGRNLSRVAGDGDRELGGLKAPGFEPDVGRVRQQAGKSFHSSYIGSSAA